MKSNNGFVYMGRIIQLLTRYLVLMINISADNIFLSICDDMAIDREVQH